MVNVKPELRDLHRLPIVLQAALLRLRQLFLHFLLRLLLFLHCSLKQLFGIFFAHLLFWLLVLVFLILVFIIVLLILVFLLVLTLIILVLVFIVLVVLLFLLLLLTQSQIVARLVVLRVVAQTLLLGIYRLAKHFMMLAHNADVMIYLRLAHLVLLQFSCRFEVSNSRRVFLLLHKRTSKIVQCLRIILIFVNSLSIVNLSSVKLLLTIISIAFSNMLTVSLCYNRQATHY